MDKFIPGKTMIPVAKKVVIDQVIQGPFMIGTMYFWTAFLNGKSLSHIQKKLEDVLWETWVNSVYVWSPVQIFQQVLVPIQYRVAVANIVSYFWDTYLSFMMMTETKPIASTTTATTTTMTTKSHINKNEDTKLVKRQTLKERKVMIRRTTTQWRVTDDD